MKRLGMRAASPGSKSVGWAFGASLAVHGVALAAIVWGWGGASPLPEGVPVMDVELVTALADPGQTGSAPAATATPTTSPAASAPSPTAQPSPPDSTAVAETSPVSDAVQPSSPAPGERPPAESATVADLVVQLPDPQPPSQAGGRHDPQVPPPAARTDPGPPPSAAAPPTLPLSSTSPPRPATPTPAPRQTAPAPVPTPAPAPPRSAPAPSVATVNPKAGSGAPSDAGASGGGAVNGGARLVRHVAPRYPALARERGLEGRVVVRLVIGADGVPGEIGVAQSSGVKSLDAAAIDAVRQWRFVPARRGGVAVAEERLAPVVFRLRH